MFSVRDRVYQVNRTEKSGEILKVLSDGNYRVKLSDGSIVYWQEEDIQRQEEVGEPIDNLFSRRIGNYSSFLITMTRERLSKEKIISEQILAFNASRTLFYPYQYKPLVKFISSEEKRVLICDEVGLGKTIEAGLILLEYMARFPTDSVLIVCPSSLKYKWIQEMKSRFAIGFTILSGNELADYIVKRKRGDSDEKLFGVISYEAFSRGSQVQDVLSGFEFDLAIFDEAHRMRNKGTMQNKAGALLCDIAHSVVMLTATPIQIKQDDLISLLRMLLPDEFKDDHTTKILLEANKLIVEAQKLAGRSSPAVERIRPLLEQAKHLEWFRDNPWLTDSEEILGDMEKKPNDLDLVWTLQKSLARLNLISHVFTRTKKRDVHGKTVKRQPHSLTVPMTEAEKEIYNDILNKMARYFKEKHKPPLIFSWVMNNVERRIASCLPAALEHFKMFESDEENHLESDWEEEFYANDSFFDNASLEKQDRKTINAFYRMLASYSNPAVDSKADKLLECIDGLRKNEPRNVQLIIFASFRKTLEYLENRLKKKGYSVRMLHGGVKTEERPDIIEAFKNDEAQVSILLSSRVGGEGLDMQFAHNMVNYDLPWNPMEVEQRIGRLDRIGQRAGVIHIYHLFLENTIEQRILERLYSRVGLFESTIGELEPILGEIVKRTMEIMFSNVSNLEKAEEEYKKQIERMLVSQEKELQELEKESAHFIGTDAFFTEEVERVRDRQLYITADQMRLFFENFIRDYCPASLWDYDPQKKIGKFKPAHDFSDIRQKYFQDDAIILHKQFMSGRSYDVTFDRDTAYRLSGSVEFINNLHPLTNLMINVYKRNRYVEKNSFYDAFHILIENDSKRVNLPNGFYFFSIAKIDIYACNPVNQLEFAILDDAGEPLPPKESEELFAYILEKGEDWELPLPKFDKNDNDGRSIIEQNKKLGGILLRRLDTLRAEVRKNNDLFINRRLTSLTATYERKREKLLEQIETRKSKGEDERTLRLPRGSLDHLDARYKVDVAELDGKRKVSAEQSMIACGILEIRDRRAS